MMRPESEDDEYEAVGLLVVSNPIPQENVYAIVWYNDRQGCSLSAAGLTLAFPWHEMAEKKTGALRYLAKLPG
jgi:hypothetical protein